MTYKAIDIGCGTKSWIKEYIHVYIPEWDGEEVEVVNLDGDEKIKPDILHNLMEPMPEELKGQFDLVYSAHVLEHISWLDTVSVAMEMASLVKEGGYMIIAVPSMEWACKELLRGNFNKGVMMTFYGGQEDEWLYHKCGFSKPSLEVLAQRLGMKVLSLRESSVILTDRDRQWNATQHELFMRKEKENGSL